MIGRIRRFFCRSSAFYLTFLVVLQVLALAGNAMPLFDLINLFVVPLSWGMIGLAAYALLYPSTNFLRLFALACLITSGAVLTQPLLQAPVRRACIDEPISITWLNTEAVDQPYKALRWLDNTKPRVAGFAELRSKSKRMRQALGNRFPYMQSCLRNGRCSTILYSHEVPSAAESLARSDPENRRGLSAVKIAVEAPDHNSGMTIIAVHLSRPLPLGNQQRELAELEQAIIRPADTVVIGDFNLSSRMKVLSGFAKRNGLQVAVADRPTWPLHVGKIQWPGFWQIDHLLVGRNWHVLSMTTSENLGSDHRGFAAKLCRVGE